VVNKVAERYFSAQNVENFELECSLATMECISFGGFISANQRRGFLFEFLNLNPLL